MQCMLTSALYVCNTEHRIVEPTATMAFIIRVTVQAIVLGGSLGERSETTGVGFVRL